MNTPDLLAADATSATSLPAADLFAGFAILEQAAAEYEDRTVDIPLEVGQRLVDVHVGGMREAAELLRGWLGLDRPVEVPGECP